MFIAVFAYDANMSTRSILSFPATPITTCKSNIAVFRLFIFSPDHRIGGKTFEVLTDNNIDADDIPHPQQIVPIIILVVYFLYALKMNMIIRNRSD